MLASEAADVIRYTLNVGTGEITSSPGGSELTLATQALRYLESMRQWKFLERRSSPLSLIKGESYILLPDDFREIIALDTTESLLNRLELTSYRHLLELRTSSIQSQSFSYYAAVAHNEGKTKNLLGFTEAFDNAAWTKTGVSVGADATVSPAGEAAGSETADRLTATATSDFADQAVVAANLEASRDYVFSIYLKADTTTASTVKLTQRGTGGGTGSSRVPFTQVAITWSGGAPSLALTNSDDTGAHDSGTEDVGNGWHRIYVSLTFDQDQSKPSIDMDCQVFPDTAVGTNALFAWGAQLESFDVSTIDLKSQPTRYEANSGAYAESPGPVFRRLEVWPTPSADLLRAFTVFYRKKLPAVASEADEILLMEYVEPLYLELCRIVARGAHEEDVSHTHERMESLEQSMFFRRAVDQDDTAQTDYGPMRGLASHKGWLVRDWGSDAIVPSPGA